MHSRLRKTPNTATPGAVVQLVRIRACHARGRGFEPHPHRKNASHICEGHFSYGIVCSWAKAGTCVVREPGSAASCKLKRFPRTTNPKFAITCVNRAFLLTGKFSRRGWLHQNVTSSFDKPSGGGASGSPARIPNWNYTTLIPTAAESLVKTYQCQIFAGPGLGLLVIQVCHLEFHQNGITLDNIGKKRLCARTHQRTDIHVAGADGIHAYDRKNFLHMLRPQ